MNRQILTVYGNAVDVLADMMENRTFFGAMVSEEPGQATNPNNGHIAPVVFTPGQYVAVSGAVIPGRGIKSNASKN
jgi:hypothetical protein